MFINLPVQISKIFLLLLIVNSAKHARKFVALKLNTILNRLIALCLVLDLQSFREEIIKLGMVLDLWVEMVQKSCMETDLHMLLKLIVLSIQPKYMETAYSLYAA